MTKPGRDDIVSITAFVSYQRDRVLVNVSRQWYGKGVTKHQGKVRAFVVSFDVPLLDDDLIKVLGSAVLYCGDPNKRHLKPPRARFWREAGLESSVPPGGGEGGAIAPEDPPVDPLPGLSTQDLDGSTITTGPEVVGGKSAEGGSAKARAPRTRKPRAQQKSSLTEA